MHLHLHLHLHLYDLHCLHCLCLHYPPAALPSYATVCRKMQRRLNRELTRQEKQRISELLVQVARQHHHQQQQQAQQQLQSQSQPLPQAPLYQDQEQDWERLHCDLQMISELEDLDGLDDFALEGLDGNCGYLDLDDLLGNDNGSTSNRTGNCIGNGNGSTDNSSTSGNTKLSASADANVDADLDADANSNLDTEPGMSTKSTLLHSHSHSKGELESFLEGLATSAGTAAAWMEMDTDLNDLSNLSDFNDIVGNLDSSLDSSLDSDLSASLGEISRALGDLSGLEHLGRLEEHSEPASEVIRKEIKNEINNEVKRKPATANTTGVFFEPTPLPLLLLPATTAAAPTVVV